MRQHLLANNPTTWKALSAGTDFAEDVRYDANGNILSLGISDYSAFNNSPITFGDPLGDTSTLGTRVVGGLKGVGGLLEMGIGGVGGVATSWSGVGGVLGAAAVIHGADGASNGFSQMITGKETKSFTESAISGGLQAASVSSGTADMSAGFFDFTLSAFLSAGAGSGGNASGSFSMLLKGSSEGGALSKEAATGGQGIFKMAATSGGSAKVPLSLKPANANEIVAGCEKVAKSVQKVIGGEFLQVRNSIPNLSPGPVNYAGGTAPTWFHHVAVIKKGMVYDKMTGAAGIQLNNYKKLFEYADDLIFEQVKMITVGLDLEKRTPG